MKVYLFDRGNGLFSGEDYFDPQEVNEEEGITTVPPPARQTGTVPIFDRSVGTWKLVPMESVKGKRNV